MKAVVTAAEMRAIDAETISAVGIPGAVLMENAGRAVAAEVRSLIRSGPVAAICGAGNNGGDGFVIARVLREWGIEATVYLAGNPDKLKGDAKIHFDAYRNTGGPVVDISSTDALTRERAAIASAEAVVDAVFGTGLEREVEGNYRAVIEAINATTATVVAVDLPSGLSADSGAALGVCARADVTVTMAFHKRATASAPGHARCGRVVVAEIGIPARLAADQGVGVQLVEASDVAAMLPSINVLDYKNRRGHLLVAGGSAGKRGAARLAASAGLRTGAGLVTLVSDEHDTRVDDSIMTAVAADAGELLTLATGKACVAMGPGMDAGASGRAVVDALLTGCQAPLVIDADGLNHLAERLDAVAAATAPVVLTPHPGEAARLLGTTSSEIEADRIASVRALALRSEAVCVLKGARTVVGSGEMVFVIAAGDPALATAGSGDVLTGVIAALAAQGLEARDAAIAGCFLHARAGELGAARYGSRGLVSSDLPALVAEARAVLEPR
ncbi:MAG: NAD(P)H-hydrate dehydratase [Deltaproteobacteria bacterium]|nr:NAD(P)H-hydrate dehydratase [Deltaproteobacteria bacterium]